MWEKGWHYTETWDDLLYFSLCCHFLLISIAPWQSWLDHAGTRKIPPPDMEEELMMEAKHLLKTEEEGGLPFAQLSLDCKTVAHWVLGAAPSCLPACEPHHRPTLMEPCLAFPSAPWWVLSVLREKSLCWAKSWDMLCCFSMRKTALCWALFVWHMPFTRWQELVKWPNAGAGGPGKCTPWWASPAPYTKTKHRCFLLETQQYCLT